MSWPFPLVASAPDILGTLLPASIADLCQDVVKSQGTRATARLRLCGPSGTATRRGRLTQVGRHTSRHHGENRRSPGLSRRWSYLLTDAVPQDVVQGIHGQP
jgi:hypothetical protein